MTALPDTAMPAAAPAEPETAPSAKPTRAEPGGDLVSVVIPAFNRAATIAGSIRSADAQTWPALEILVIDDRSTDDTVAVAETVATRHPLRVLRQPVNGGAGAARNTGIREARGRWIAFLDSDDTWEPDKIARQLAAMAETGRRLCYCDIWRIYGGRPPQRRGTGGDGDLHRALAGRNVVGGASNVIADRALLLDHGGFDTDLICAEDWDLWLRLARDEPWAVVDAPLVRYDAGDGDRMSTNWRRQMAGHAALHAKLLRADPMFDDAARARYAVMLAEILAGLGRGRAMRRLLRYAFGRAAWPDRARILRRTVRLHLDLHARSRHLAAR